TPFVRRSHSTPPTEDEVMPTINAPGSGHGSFISPAGNQYLEYADATALQSLKQAVAIIDRTSRVCGPATTASRRFRAGGPSLTSGLTPASGLTTNHGQPWGGTA